MIRSFPKLLKKDSATALSHQLARLLVLGSRWRSLQKRHHASLPFCEPGSEWLNALRGRLVRTALSTACSTSSVLNDPTLKWLTSAEENVALFDLDAHAEDAVNAFLSAYQTSSSELY